MAKQYCLRERLERVPRSDKGARSTSGKRDGESSSRHAQTTYPLTCATITTKMATANTTKLANKASVYLTKSRCCP